ncbi:MAG: hypothetical protein ABSF03_31450 [Streptosporangiaceae bacterium]|jgi:hypothetical protein
MRFHRFAAVLLSICTVGLGTGAAHAATTTRPSTVVLIPNAKAYCIAGENLPDQAYVANDEWVVIFHKLVGTPGKNNWACQYWIRPTIPLPVDGDIINIPAPWAARYLNFPIYWGLMCSEQFPGAKAQRVRGPVGVARYGPGGAPWVCVGPAQDLG